MRGSLSFTSTPKRRFNFGDGHLDVRLPWPASSSSLVCGCGVYLMWDLFLEPCGAVLILSSSPRAFGSIA